MRRRKAAVVVTPHRGGWWAGVVGAAGLRDRDRCCSLLGSQQLGRLA
jgi:hypothetical protein